MTYTGNWSDVRFLSWLVSEEFNNSPPPASSQLLIKGAFWQMLHFGLSQKVKKKRKRSRQRSDTKPSLSEHSWQRNSVCDAWFCYEQVLVKQITFITFNTINYTFTFLAFQENQSTCVQELFNICFFVVVFFNINCWCNCGWQATMMFYNLKVTTPRRVTLNV